MFEELTSLGGSHARVQSLTVGVDPMLVVVEVDGRYARYTVEPADADDFGLCPEDIFTSGNVFLRKE